LRNTFRFEYEVARPRLCVHRHADPRESGIIPTGTPADYEQTHDRARLAA